MLRLAGLTAALACVVLCATAYADPQPYSMTVCADPATQTPIGSTSVPAGWLVKTDDNLSFAIDCKSTPSPSTGFHFQGVAGTRPKPNNAFMAYKPPADVLIAGADFYRYVHTENDFVGQDTAGQDCPGSAGNPCTLGTLAAPFDPANRVVWAAPKPVDEFDIEFKAQQCTPTDMMGGCQPVNENGNSTYRFYGGQLKLIDQTAPMFTRNPSGAALDPASPLAGSKDFSFAATDKGGGLRKLVLAVDGQDAQTYDLDANSGQCREPYTTPVPCKLADDETLSLDTTKLTDGAHRVDFRLLDVSGNAATYGPVPISVANHTVPDRGAANGTGATDKASVAVTYGGKARTALTRAYGSSTAIKGVLKNAAGQPIDAADVRIVETLDQVNAEPRDTGSIRTDAKGAFTYRIPPGPSRTIRFVYRSHANDTTEAGGFAIKLVVPAKVTLTPKTSRVRRGATVTLKGTLLGAPLPKGGKLVTLEARDGGRWREATSTHTGAKGRFIVKYRFSKRARKATYPMRIRVRPDGSYPYAQGFSATVRVTVR